MSTPATPPPNPGYPGKPTFNFPNSGYPFAAGGYIPPAVPLTPPNRREFSGVAEFAMGQVRGTRSFRLDPAGRLKGINYQTIWNPGENIAQCLTVNVELRSVEIATGQFVTEVNYLPNDRDPHPLTECAHGFYAYYDGSDDYHSASGIISGVIEGYGEVLIGTRGFRCMKARIIALCTDKPERADIIARLYPDIPMFSSYLQMISEFPPDYGAARDAEKGDT